MKRSERFLIIASIFLTTSCHPWASSGARLKGRQHWSRVRARVKFQLAEQHHRAGRFREAVRAATDSIALDGTQADAYVLLARGNLELGRLASAWQAVKLAERAGVRSADLLYMRGVILEQRGRYEDAVEAYGEARRLDPNNIDYLIAQAEALVALNRPAEAVKLLDDNGERFDDDTTVYALSAHIAALMGDARQAMGRYEQALSGRAPSRVVSEELGRLLQQAGRSEEALAVLRPLLDSPDDSTALGSIRRIAATCHLALGHAAEAKKVLADYAQVSPDDTLAQLLLAKAALATNDWMTALRAVDLVQQRELDRPELRLVRAAVRWKRGNLAAAASDLYHLIQSRPQDVEAHCLLAEVLRAQKRPEAARRYFRRALELDSGCAWADAGLQAIQNMKPEGATERPAKLTAADRELAPVDSQR